MKKHLLSFFAIAVAIAFSAFTSPALHQRTGAQKAAPSLFWYVINADGSLGTALNGGAQMDKPTALNYTPCQDVTSLECNRGYSSRQIVGTKPAPPTNSSTDYHINFTQ